MNVPVRPTPALKERQKERKKRANEVILFRDSQTNHVPRILCLFGQRVSARRHTLGWWTPFSKKETWGSPFLVHIYEIRMHISLSFWIACGKRKNSDGRKNARTKVDCFDILNVPPKRKSLWSDSLWLLPYIAWLPAGIPLLCRWQIKKNI